MLISILFFIVGIIVVFIRRKSGKEEIKKKYQFNAGMILTFYGLIQIFIFIFTTRISVIISFLFIAVFFANVIYYIYLKRNNEFKANEN